MFGFHAEGSQRGVNLVKMAAAYLVLGLVLGLAMSATHQFQLRPVHTHMNLLGWATMGLAGLVYCAFPRAGATRLAAWHFWLHNLGLPVMMLGLAAYSLGQVQFEPVIAAGSLLVTAGMLMFAITVFLHISPHQVQEDRKVRGQGTASA